MRTIAPFSPLADKAPVADADAIYLPDTPLFTATDVFGERNALIGHACGNVTGSFIHRVERADKF